MDWSTPGSSLLYCFPEFAWIHVHWVSDDISPSHPLLPPSFAFSIFQHQGTFQWVSSLHQVPNYWGLSFSTSPSSEYSGLVSFRIDWFDLLAVQGPLKSLLQHHNLKAPILQCSAFFMVQLSHMYRTPGKITAATKLKDTFSLENSYNKSSSVAQSCPTLCNPMNHSTPGLPVHHQLPEFTQTHVHWVGDAIQPSHPLSSSSPPAFNLSQHQGLLQWVSSLHQVAKVLEFQLQHQSFQQTPRTDLL